MANESCTPAGPWHRRAMHLLNVIILCGLIGLAYGRSVHYGFVWDDRGLIVNNTYVQNIANWPALLFGSFWQIGQNVEEPSRSFYRPLISLSYAANHAVAGLEPYSYHLTNIAAHVVCTLLVYALACLLLGNPWFALLGAIVFAIHPAHIENVCWIAGRTDIFCGVFFVIAFIGFLRWEQGAPGGGVLLGLSLASYALALLSKEMALSFPLIVAFWAVCRRVRARSAKAIMWVLAAYAAVTAAYLFLRLITLGRIAGEPGYGSAWERAISVPAVMARYVGLALNLRPVDPHHPASLLASVWSAGFLAGVAVVAVMGLIVVFLHQKRQGSAVFLLGWFFLSLIPVLRLGVFGDVLLADRFLYIPSIGLALAIPAIASWISQDARWRDRRIVWAGGIVYGLFIVGLLVASRSNASYWQSDLALFARAARTSPHSAYIHFNLGNSLARAGSPAGAIAAYSTALKLDPDYWQALTNLGAALDAVGSHEDAARCFVLAHEKGDRSHLLFANLGHAYRRLDRTREAIEAYKKSLSVLETESALNNLGECYLATGERDLALQSFMKARRLNPSTAVYNNIGLTYMQQTNHGKALSYLQYAAEHTATNAAPADTFPIQYNLAKCLSALGRPSAAAFHASNAVILLNTIEQPEAQQQIRQELTGLMEGGVTQSSTRP